MVKRLSFLLMLILILTVAVTTAVGAGTVDVRVDTGADDAEEASAGDIDKTSSDLELIRDGSDLQTIGIRFNGIEIPQGATITEAYIQFKADETDSDTTPLTIQGEAVDNASAFSSVDYDISSRTRTVASVAWSPPPWSSSGEAGPDQRTSDISQVIEEVVDRPGWTSGNSLVV